MSAPTPSRLVDFAPPDAVPRVGEGFDPLRANLTPEDYFVLIRIDGRATLKELFVASGLAEATFVRAVSKLRTAGALLLPGDVAGSAVRGARDAPTSIGGDDDTGFGQDGSIGSVGFGSLASGMPNNPPRPPPRAASPRPVPTPRAAAIPTPVPATAEATGRFPKEPSSGGFAGARGVATDNPNSAISANKAGKAGGTADASGPARRYESSPRLDVAGLDLSALEEPNDLTQDQRRAILIMEHVVKTGTLYEILDSKQEAGEKEIRRAYFRISKDFHPDRYFGRALGTYKDRLALIFERASRAWAVLSDEDQRASYDGRAARPESAAEQAQRIYKEACEREVAGELDRALELFDAAVRVDGRQPKILRRAAEALLRHAATVAGVPGGVGSDPGRLADGLARVLTASAPGPQGPPVALIAKARESLERAGSYAKKAAELQPRDASSHRTLSRVLRAGHDLDGARRALEQARRIEPENAHVVSELDEVIRLLMATDPGQRPA